MQNRSSVRVCSTHCIHVLARLTLICSILRRCLLTKFLHRSSVGSLLRVRLLVGRPKRRRREKSFLLLLFPGKDLHGSLILAGYQIGREEKKEKKYFVENKKGLIFYCGERIGKMEEVFDIQTGAKTCSGLIEDTHT